MAISDVGSVSEMVVELRPRPVISGSEICELAVEIRDGEASTKLDDNDADRKLVVGTTTGSLGKDDDKRLVGSGEATSDVEMFVPFNKDDGKSFGEDVGSRLGVLEDPTVSNEASEPLKEVGSSFKEDERMTLVCETETT